MECTSQINKKSNLTIKEVQDLGLSVMYFSFHSIHTKQQVRYFHYRSTQDILLLGSPDYSLVYVLLLDQTSWGTTLITSFLHKNFQWIPIAFSMQSKLFIWNSTSFTIWSHLPWQINFPPLPYKHPLLRPNWMRLRSQTTALSFLRDNSDLSSGFLCLQWASLLLSSS